ncbi:MAG: TolC family protein [Bacteroidota bacterium]
MRNFRKYGSKAMSFMLCMILPYTSFANEEDSTMRLSAKEAIDYALAHQKDVSNASLDAKISDAQVKEIIGMGLPQFNGSIDMKDFFELPTSLIPGEFFGGAPGSFVPVRFGTQWQSTVGVTATQLLFDPSYLIGVQATKTIRELAKKNLKRTRIETASAVYKAYYSLLLVRERKKVVDANISRLFKLKKDTKALYSNGFVEKIDLDRVNLAYNNIVSEKDRIENMEAATENLLKFQMGMQIGNQIELSDSLDISKVKALTTGTSTVDVTKRIEYDILKTQYRLQEYNVKRYRVGYYPSLVGFANLSTTAQRDAFNLLDPSRRWYPTGILGATLNIPIFDGFQKSAKIKQNEFRLEKIKNEITNFENAVTMQAENSRLTLEDALRTLDLQEQNLTLAKEVVRTAKVKYDQGVGSNLEVLDSETQLREAQSNYFNSVYSAIIAKIDYELAVGNIEY